MAVRAALSAPDFETGLRSVVELGDDADTNGAIAGALLGARFGVNGIPTRWRNAIHEGESLTDFAIWAHDHNHG
jgi:ADP-ribosylglycohydrolase